MEKKEIQNSNLNSLTKYKIKKTMQLLASDIESIRDVQGWANAAGVSREWLYKSLKIIYGKAPKVILREARFENVVQLLRKHGTAASCYSVAVDAGFRSEDALSKWLTTFYGMNFTELKTKILKEQMN
jgi:methylphosphotriester-DNA--protein-cysteine methyltransferase